MDKELIATENAPAAVGPYSQAVKIGNLLYTAGQIGIDPKTGKMVSGGVKAQAVQVLENLSAVLHAAGSGFEHVIKTTIFLRYMKDFGEINRIYAGYVGEKKPARSTVAVASLPLGAMIEIEVVALIPDAAEDLPDAGLTNETDMSKKKKSGKKGKKDKKSKNNKKKGKK